MQQYLDFYGLIIEVSSPSAEVVKHVRRDFAYFGAEKATSRLQIEICVAPPPYESLPALPASFLTPRNVVYHQRRTNYIDYFGRGLAVYDRDKHRCMVYGTDPDLLREIVYLFILSTVGQYLDRRGLHRVHALGVSYAGRGILLLLPSGGGKSTMALELLRQPGFSFLSEDTPLIDRKGRMLPFHLPLGIRPGRATGIPSQYLRTVRRMEFDPKTLIDIEYFQDRFGKAVAPELLLVGQRNLGEISDIVPLARYRAMKALMKYLVVGLGVYQGLEFLLERGLGDAVGNFGVGFSRLYSSLRLLGRARAYRFVLGRNPEMNCRTLVEFIRRTYEPK